MPPRVVAAIIEGTETVADITFSNSMIEAFWRSLKHSWLYLHSLESIESLRRLVDFYVRQHNEVMPHAAFEGQTPDEMFFGTGGGVIVELAALRKAAREERMKLNQLARCGVCVGESHSAMLQVQRLQSQMSLDAAGLRIPARAVPNRSESEPLRRRRDRSS